MHPLFKFLHHKWFDCGRHWFPFVGIYYLTYACDFRCPYCANGQNIPFHALPNPAVDEETVLRILKRIRQYCDHLVITGGEPLAHPEAAQVIGALNTLGFHSVTLTTNGEAIDTLLPQFTGNISTLVVSLDTLDAHKADAWYGKGSGTFAKIRANIEKAADAPGRDYTIMLSSVVTPNNINDLYDVYDYTQSRGFTFSASPELQGIQAPLKLRQSQTYRDFFNFLIREKQKNRAIFGSTLYLRYMRDFRPFVCHPLSTLVVNPNGGVFCPCLEKGHIAGNILEKSPHALHRQAADHARCEHACHSPCALGFSLAIEKSGRELAGLITQSCTSLIKVLRTGGI